MMAGDASRASCLRLQRVIKAGKQRREGTVLDSGYIRSLMRRSKGSYPSSSLHTVFHYFPSLYQV